MSSSCSFLSGCGRSADDVHEFDLIMPRDSVIAYHQHQINDGLTQAAAPGPAASVRAGAAKAAPA
jgi:hypothetical protein